MNYQDFLKNRGAHFHHTAVRQGDGVVCITGFGGIDLTTHVSTLAEGYLERKLVDDIGGFGVMHEHCTIEPLVEYQWKVEQWRKLRLVVQFVKDTQGRTFICVQRDSHRWYAIARINNPSDPMLLKAFFSSRRSHDREGFGFCASKGSPQRITNYRPDLLDRQTIVKMYGYWLRWAEKSVGGMAFHSYMWEDVKHGIGTKNSDILSLSRSVQSRIVNRPYTTAEPNKADAVTARRSREKLDVDDPTSGKSLPERLQWYRDGYEYYAGYLLHRHMKEEKFEAARDLVTKLIIIVGDKPEELAEHYLKLGVINERIADYESASLAYRHALALEPKDEATWYYAHNNLGYCLNQLHQYREAEPFLRQAIEVDSHTYNAYKNLGVSMAGLGEYAEAAHLFVKATVMSPYDPRALDHLEELLDEHQVVYLQLPEIRAELEKCRHLVKRKGAA